MLEEETPEDSCRTGDILGKIGSMDGILHQEYPRLSLRDTGAHLKTSICGTQ